MALSPLPVPGVAIFPQFQSSNHLSLTLKRGTFNADFTATHNETGATVLFVSADKLSASHRKHIIDPNTDQEICEIRKEALTMHSRYYGTSPATGMTLFETETHVRFGGPQTVLRFVNNANGGQQDELEFHGKSFSYRAELVYRGSVVAVVEKKKFSMGSQYDLQIARGLDPTVVVAVVVAMDDRQRTNNGGVAAAGAGAAS